VRGDLCYELGGEGSAPWCLALLLHEVSGIGQDDVGRGQPAADPFEPRQHETGAAVREPPLDQQGAHVPQPLQLTVAGPPRLRLTEYGDAKPRCGGSSPTTSISWRVPCAPVVDDRGADPAHRAGALDVDHGDQHVDDGLGRQARNRPSRAVITPAGIVVLDKAK